MDGISLDWEEPDSPIDVSPPPPYPTSTIEGSPSPATEPKSAGTSSSMDTEQSTPWADPMRRASWVDIRGSSTGRDRLGAPKSARIRKSRSSVGTLMCPSCSCTFTIKKNLRGMSRCSSFPASKPKLPDHIKRHENKMAYACPATGCGQRYNTPADLRLHRYCMHREEDRVGSSLPVGNLDRQVLF